MLNKTQFIMSKRLTDSMQIIGKNTLGFDEETQHVLTENILNNMTFMGSISRQVIHDTIRIFENINLSDRYDMKYSEFLNQISTEKLTENKLKYMLKNRNIQQSLCSTNSLYKLYLNEWGVLKDYDYDNKPKVCTEANCRKLSSSTINRVNNEIKQLIELNCITLTNGRMRRCVIMIIMYDVLFKNYYVVSSSPNFKKVCMEKIKEFIDCDEDRGTFDLVIQKYSLPANLLNTWYEVLIRE